MNRIWPVATRPGCSRLQKVVSLETLTVCARLFSSVVGQSTQCPKPHSQVSRRQNRLQVPERHGRSLSQSRKVDFAQSFARQKLTAYKPAAQHQKLSFRQGNLSAQELTAIFGQDRPPSALTNQLLRVLHGRRVDGTLDLPLPKEFDVTLRRYPSAMADGLRWLRQNYPFDEEGAIVRRIEREEAQQEKQNPSDLVRRGEGIGLYKPQSGNYQAPLSEVEGDVFGVSQIEKKQAENIIKAEQEEQELQQEIDKIQEEVQERVGQLAIRPETSLETSQGFRPPNSFEKWILRSKLNASSKLTLEDVADKGPWRRLLPSFFFVALVMGLCFLYTLTWMPPKRSERLFPDVGLAFATIGGVITANLCVYALWKWPPAWRLLNKYFITVPGMPIPLSLLGNVFSHQTFKHVAVNMLWLLILGLSLHEDIGRGNFLGLYVAGGVFGSLVSASSYVFRGVLFTSHLGASGAVSAVVAAYCMLHAEDRFTFFVVPSDWQDTVSFTGIQFFTCMMLWEGAQFISIRYFARYRTTDFAAHFGGYAVGVLAGWWFRQDKDREIYRKAKRKRTWIDHLLETKDLGGKT